MSIAILIKSLFVRLSKHIQSQVSRGVSHWQRILKNGTGVDPMTNWDFKLSIQEKFNNKHEGPIQKEIYEPFIFCYKNQ
jgi:hypothetical protein